MKIKVLALACLMYKIDKTDTTLCPFCVEKEETIYKLFKKCTIVKRSVQNLNNHCLSKILCHKRFFDSYITMLQIT